MKFRIRKFLTISMLFSMLGGYINGMENEIPHKGWNIIFREPGQTLDKININNINIIIIDKKNDECFDPYKLYGNSFIDRLRTIFSNFGISSSLSLKTNDKAYSGWGSCIRCNAKITNPENNSSKEEESFGFNSCNCKLCFGCGTSMDNFNDYKCSHGNELKDSEKKCISMIQSRYNYAKTLKLLIFGEETTQSLDQARKNYVDKLYDFSTLNKKSNDKKGISKKDIRAGVIYKENLDEAEETINDVFKSPILDIINSAMAFNIEKSEAACPICCNNFSPVCLPQCGHPICLSCLRNLANKKNNYCPICKAKFYRFVILRENMDDKSLPNFLNNNRDWIQQAIK